MVTLNSLLSPETTRERLLVVGGGADARTVATLLRQRYADWQTAHVESYLAAIADLSLRPARAILACIAPTQPHLPDAVAGLRLAAGGEARLLLCCTPTTEPLARAARGPAVNDYLILPLQPGELDRAVGRVAVDVRPRVAGNDLSDLSALAATMEVCAAEPTGALRSLAELVRARLNASGVALIVDGSMSAAGDAVARPVLSAPLLREGRIVGQILVGDGVSGPFDPADAQRLQHLATIISHLLASVSRQRQLQRLALTDEVSGLPNRRYLLEQLPPILDRARAERFPVTVLLFDVDDFKRYNDAHGHDAGDEIIRVVGQLFRQHCREQDIVVRYGGDEFAVAFWDPEGARVAGSSHPGCALNVLDRFTTSLREHAFSKLDGEARITVSGGLATYPWDGDNVEALITRADQALLAAKRAGKNKVLIMGADGESTNQ